MLNNQTATARTKEDVVTFQQVINEESLIIAERRETVSRSGKLEALPESIVALSLSGGGIRSASICLGASQALHDLGLWDDLDYISTVSGGSYIGSCISLQAAEQRQVFGDNETEESKSGALLVNERRTKSHDEDNAKTTKPRQGGDHQIDSNSAPSKFPFEHLTGTREGLAFRHLRKNSSYLTSGTIGEKIGTPLQLIRNFVINVVALSPILFIASALYCVFYGELITSLKAIMLGWTELSESKMSTADFFLTPEIIFTSYGVTTSWALLMISLFILTFFLKHDHQRSVERIIATIFVACVFIFLLESTALAVAAYDLVFSQSASAANEDNIGNWFLGWIIAISLIFMIVSHIVLRRVGGTSKLPTGRIALSVVSVGVPLLLWVTFFLMVRWQINWDSTPSKLKYAVGVVDYLDQFTGDRVLAFFEIPVSTLAHLPKMLAFGFHGQYLPSYEEVHKNTLALILLVLTVGTMLFFFVRRADPNESALHTIYRNKLANLFMFHIGRDDDGDEIVIDASETYISQLAKPTIPILLINGAIAGVRVNKNSPDLEPSVGFTFSPYHIGYEDSYLDTKTYQAFDSSITLASLVAISGAAVTPRMNGTMSRPASMLIALLNLRLGYWLPNPKLYATENKKGFIDKFPKLRHLLYEVLGPDSRTQRHIYLSDGGHYENLGVLELLRRRCTLIVAVDAEHDPNFTFPSLAKLIRIARVGLGINITIKAGAIAPSRGRFSNSHYAVGTIDYGEGIFGSIVYIKSSLTGDENHYVLNYASHHSKFPHESTLDQFFSDQQFEAYRSLGYHMVKQSMSKYMSSSSPENEQTPEAQNNEETVIVKA